MGGNPITVRAETFQGCNMAKIKGWAQHWAETVKRGRVRRRSASFALRLRDILQGFAYLFHYNIPLDKGCISCRFAALRGFPGASVSVALPSAHCTHLRPGERASPRCVLRARLPEADCSPRFLTVSCSVGGATPTFRLQHRHPAPHSPFHP